MINGRDGTNKSPRERMEAVTPGHRQYDNNNSTSTLKDSKSRYTKGMELYKSGRVKINGNGLFKVAGYYECDTERMTCTCPDYRTRKESCKHLFAAMLFVKNRGKQSIENLEERDFDEKAPHEWVDTTHPRRFKNGAPNKPVEAPKQADNKPFDRQATITRLAVLNTAVAALQTHRKPIEYGDIVSLAAQLEAWALGGGNV